MPGPKAHHNYDFKLTRYHDAITVLIETFVKTPRFTCTVYRATGWIHVVATQGRGCHDRFKQHYIDDLTMSCSLL